MLEHMPQSRVLADRFGVNRVGIVIPKGNAGRLSYFSEFVEQAKASDLCNKRLSARDYKGFRSPQRQNSLSDKQVC